jgi:hypothetical protein
VAVLAQPDGFLQPSYHCKHATATSIKHSAWLTLPTLNDFNLWYCVVSTAQSAERNNSTRDKENALEQKVAFRTQGITVPAPVRSKSNNSNAST